jgi:hypothetical protein
MRPVNTTTQGGMHIPATAALKLPGIGGDGSAELHK